MSDATTNEPNLFEIIRTTRSMRRLKPDPVPDDLIRQILEAGTCAANGGNMQSWRYLVVRDPAIKQVVATYYYTDSLIPHLSAGLAASLVARARPV